MARLNGKIEGGKRVRISEVVPRLEVAQSRGGGEGGGRNFTTNFVQNTNGTIRLSPAGSTSCDYPLCGI